MISRRTILAWLGLTPVAIAVAKATPTHAMNGPLARADAPPVRTRAWKTVLEPDGSSSFVKNGERWLDAWVKTQKEEDWICKKDRWGKVAPSLDDIKDIIQEDADAINARLDESWPKKVVEAEEAEWRLRRKALGYPPELRMNTIPTYRMKCRVANV
jgi:hypothetical protein